MIHHHRSRVLQNFHFEFIFLDTDFRVKRRYHACLENEAIQRLRMMRSVDIEEAKQIVRDVFRPCRYDLEPFGEDPKLLAKSQQIYNDYERYRRWTKLTKAKSE